MTTEKNSLFETVHLVVPRLKTLVLDCRRVDGRIAVATAPLW